MITIGICDDNFAVREVLRSFCDRFFEGRPYKVREYASGKEFLEGNSQEPCTDILLLDIEMEDLDGLQVKNFLQRQKKEVRILFVTSHDELVMEAYGKYVFGFLKKPPCYDGFMRLMKQIEEDLEQSKRSVIVKSIGADRSVLLSDIFYIEAQEKYAYVHVGTGEDRLFDGRSIRVWAEELAGSDFAMSHKSYLVNLAWVKKIQNGEVLLKNGETVRLSRRKKTEFAEQYRAYLYRQAR